MPHSGRREVDPDYWPDRLKADGANWWVETEVSWSWSLWLSDRRSFALDVVCGSVGIWEEWVELTEADISHLEQARGSDDHDRVHNIAAQLAHAHECGGR